MRRPLGPRRSVTIAATALCLASCGAPQSPPEEPDGPAGSTASVPRTEEVSVPLTEETPGALTEAGWGPLRIGMTRAEVVAAAGEDANPGAVGGPDPEQCDEFRPERAPEGMLVMIEGDRLTRITVSSGASIRTEGGFGVGDPAPPIKAAHRADAVISPHKYWPVPAEYITVWMTTPGGPDARGLVYEIGVDGEVAHIHAGGSSIQYVEGCL